MTTTPQPVLAPQAPSDERLPREFWDLLHEWADSLDEERRDWIEHRFGELFALGRTAPPADLRAENERMRSAVTAVVRESHAATEGIIALHILAAELAQGDAAAPVSAAASPDECPKCGLEEWDYVYEPGRVSPSFKHCCRCDTQWSAQ